MNIDNYSVYSTLSETEDKRDNTFDKVLVQMKNFDVINNIDAAKEYIAEIWNIKETGHTNQLAENCFIRTSENDKGLSINFVYNDENIIYYYKK